MRINKIKVGKVLNDIGNIPSDKIPTTDNGSLNVIAFNSMEEIQKAKSELIVLGVGSKELLRKNGFIVASMILSFGVEK